MDQGGLVRRPGFVSPTFCPFLKIGKCVSEGTERNQEPIISTHVWLPIESDHPSPLRLQTAVVSVRSLIAASHITMTHTPGLNLHILRCQWPHLSSHPDLTAPSRVEWADSFQRDREGNTETNCRCTAQWRGRFLPWISKLLARSCLELLQYLYKYSTEYFACKGSFYVLA